MKKKLIKKWNMLHK